MASDGARGRAQWSAEEVAKLWLENILGNTTDFSSVDALLPFVLSIRDRRGQLVSLVPNEAQRRYARNRSRRNIILKARQLGITTYIAARFFLTTIWRPGTVTLQVAHSLESAQQIFRIVHRFLRHLTPTLEGRVITSHANVRELAFPRLDSRYIVDTAGNSLAGRGLTVHNLHASEVALWPGDPRETMAALLAAVSPGGCVDLESTPRGIGGYFHSEWDRARRGEGWTPHFFPWWIEPAYRLSLLPGETLRPLTEDEERLQRVHGLSPEQLKFRRRLQAEFGELAPQEYAETDTDCFLATARPVFDVARIQARLQTVDPPCRTEQNGAIRIWFPPEAGRRYIIGADVAEGVPGGDFSAAVVIDALTGLQCAELQERWPVDRFARELAGLGAYYNHATLAVERNNQGQVVLHVLRHEIAYPEIYHHLGTDDKATEGWPTNVRTKPEAMQILSQMLRVSPEALVSKALLEECRSFSFGDAGKMNAVPGTHDDLVIAMAIAQAVRARGDAIRLSALER